MRMTNPVRPDLESLPARLSALPVDERGYPVPWFVSWVDGKPEFRAMDGDKWRRAVSENRCWVCGDQLGVYKTFVAGPMCGINRTSAEPPSHLECAEWSARNCPFLKNKNRKRREDDLINAGSFEEGVAGMAILRNPGVTMLWTTRRFSLFRDGRSGWLIQMGDPHAVKWYADGRPATRDEVIASVEFGLPILMKVAEAEAEEAVWQLQSMKKNFERFYPKAA